MLLAVVDHFSAGAHLFQLALVLLGAVHARVVSAASGGGWMVARLLVSVTSI
jgi:hypothetical protein